MSTKPWGGTGSTGIGSWAADAEAELAETEILQAAAAAAASNPKTFPSLKESITTKPKKKKMTLSEFYGSTTQPGPDSRSGSRLTPDEMAHLPTGPTLRSPDEYVSGSRGWGGAGAEGSNRDRGAPRREYDAPPPPVSRADEVDDWGATKRNVSMSREMPRFDRDKVSSSSSNSRYGDLGGGGGSRADDADNWSFGKKPVPVSVPPVTNSSNFGSGFGRETSGSDWRKGGDSGPKDEPVERRRLVLDPRSSNRSNNSNEGNVVSKESPFGVARPREEVLTEKGLDWKKLDSEYESKKVSSIGVGGGGGGGGSRPTSSQSNREENVSVGGGEVKARVKVNPFGDAKPREVLLEEKGLDWRKIDLELEYRRVDRPETEEEKALKEEIENLRKDLEKELGADALQGSGDVQTNLRGLIQSKERDLEILIRELDDKIRFGQKVVERPGSGAGRPGSGAGRPSSAAGRPSSGAGRPGSGGGRHMGVLERPQSVMYDDHRGTEVMDRPRSRGQGDVWTRPGDERRGGFQASREERRGGYQGNREERRGGFQGYREERRGGFQGNREERRGGFQGNRDEGRGGFQGNRDGGFLSNRDSNRPTSRW